ncbi:MAG: TMEM175 family protein [Chloroflexia bacterium]
MSAEKDMNMADERGTNRLEAFSDGVFAIAVTLLVLDIKVPEVEGQAGSLVLTDALLMQWPAYASYALSFITIGILWANHHRVYANIVRTNHSYLIMNVVYLMLVGVFPFPTAMLSKYIEDVDKQAVVTQIYTGLSLLISIVHMVSWTYASRSGHLLREGTDPKWARGIDVRNRVGLSLFGLCFLLSFVSIYASLGLFCLMVLFYLLPGRLTGIDRR